MKSQIGPPVLFAMLAALIWPLRVSATVTPLSSSLYLYVDVNAGTGPVVDDHGLSQLETLNPLSGSVSATTSSPGGIASSFMEATASWTSAAAGQIAFHSQFSTGDLTAYRDSRVNAGYGPNFLYTFRSDLPATCSISYDVVHTGDFPYGTVFSAGGKIGSDYLGGVFVQGITLFETSSGGLSFVVQPGIDYTVWVAEGSNLNQYLPPLGIESYGTFAFQITPVPEPSIPALCVLATMLLVRRRVHTTASPRRVPHIEPPWR
jgi:hypothetical protein